jgi:hypothetical protein
MSFPSRLFIESVCTGIRSRHSRILVLFRECLDHSNFELNPNLNETTLSQGSYAKLPVVADVLLRSRFLKELIDDHNCLDSKRTDNAQRLKRRLGKVCQYVSIAQLISFVKRLFPKGNVPFHWVQSVFDGTGGIVRALLEPEWCGLPWVGLADSSAPRYCK